MSDLISVLPTFNPLALFIALNGLNTLSTLRIFTTDMVSFLKTKDIQHLTCLISVNKGYTTFNLFNFCKQRYTACYLFYTLLLLLL